MTRRKIGLISLLSLALSIGVFFICFFSIPRLTYTYDSVYDGYLVDKAYGNAKSYTIPKIYKGSPVVGVGTRAFFRHSHLEEIVFEEEDNIEFIGRLAFSECRSLKSISLSCVKEIERNAFSYDTSLERVTLEAKYIGASAFYGCTGLSEVTLRMGVTSIGTYAFSKCEALKEITLPQTVKAIYENAFSFSGLEKIYAYDALKTNAYLSSLDYVIFYE